MAKMALKILRPVLAAFALLYGVAAVPAWAEDFVSVIDDLPLMAGLVETTEGVEFSTPQGRLAETTAHAKDKGALNGRAVLDFYSRTLPQLGWTQQSAKPGTARFVREGETLDLTTVEEQGQLTVRFSLAPTEK